MARKLLLAGVLLSIAILMLSNTVFAQSGKLPERSQIADKYRWHLQDIYTDTTTWKIDLDKFIARLPEFEKYKGKLGGSADILYRCLSLKDSLGIVFGKLYVYAGMKLDEDTRVSQQQEMQRKIGGVSSQFDEVTSFISPEILSIPNDKIEGFLISDSRLKLYAFYIENLIRTKAHILSPSEESILALAGIATRGPENIFNMIDNADIKYPTVTDSKGEKIQLSKERYYEVMESSDRKLRADAAKAYNEAYTAYFNALGATLTSSVNDDWFYAQARKYKTCLEHSLDNDNIPASVFMNLISAVDSNLAPLHKWVSIRKRMMGISDMHSYDLWVPLVPEAKEKIPYDQAAETIQKGLKPLGSDYLKNVNTALASNWIDVYETEGKTSGGYSWGSYATHPYILMNYNDNMTSLFTLAHEMGHTMHAFYSDRTQPYIYSDPSLFVAEVASTTNEALLIKYLLDNTKDKKKKMYLLTYYIEQIIGSFYTQVMFSEFEKKIHEVVEQGGALSSESMKNMYREIYQKYWGPELVLDDWSGIGGMTIPHFYRSYYVYVYATSYAAAQTVSQKILNGDKNELKNYMTFLSSGGNDYPVEELKKAGVDLTTSQPVDATIKLFSDLVNQMDKLLSEK